MGGCFADVSGGKAAVGCGGSNVVATASDEVVDCLFRSKGFQPLYTRIELSLSALKLSDLHTISERYPMAIVYAKNTDGTLKELGRTEMIMNNLDPIWHQKLTVTFEFETVQLLIFQMYGVDTKYHNLSTEMRPDLKDQDFVGEANCILSQIMNLRRGNITLKLRGRNVDDVRNLGSITVCAEVIIDPKLDIEMKLRCSNLKYKCLFFKCDPFLRISRIVKDGTHVPIWETEVVSNKSGPVWKPLRLNVQQFVSKDNPLLVECFDSSSSGNHTLIGKLQTSIEALEKLYNGKAGANFVFPSSHQDGHEKVLKGKLLFVDEYKEKEVYSFLDLIYSQFELNFMVAVDFTASNGEPQSPDSLHYIDPSGCLNAYQQAIMKVGEVIQVYDYDKRFPAWGFGGSAADGSVAHCFNLNGNTGNSEVEGVRGIMTAYRNNALRSVSLHGPTLLAPVVKQAAEIAAQSLSNNSNKYFVLLIITDGVLTDLQETKDALVSASDLPLSILIVGVGNADFKQMEILGADNGRRLESSTGKIATRHIVQFIPMRNVHYEDASRVLHALLEGQLLTYMRSRDIRPLNATNDLHHVPFPPDPLSR
ncbi:protein BONZAI 3-like [Rutidosis leptorrhynchoides]|uniref:protein BONZAI 3-like n=1 Tax=Rutidosis leptorrhynchoides TaxID=125765 RepID=UPI003A98D100